MDYQRIYNEIINHALVNVNKSEFESHHIIPKFMGGNDEKSNLVKLTPRQHYLCHVLLTKIVPENKKYSAVKACFMMLNWSYTNENRIKINPGFSKKIIRNNKILMPKEIREKVAQGVRNQFKDPVKRKKHLDGVMKRYSKPEEIEKLSKSQNLRFSNPLEGEKISNGLKKYFKENGCANKGRSFSHMSEEERKKTFGRKQKKGVKRSQETIDKMKASWARRKEAKTLITESKITITI